MIRIVMLLLGFLWPFLLKLFWYLVAIVGVGFVTYAGVSTGLDYLLNQLISGEQNLAATGGTYAGFAAAIAGRFGVDAILAGIMAGYTTRLALAGVGTLKRMVFKV